MKKKTKQKRFIEMLDHTFGKGTETATRLQRAIKNKEMKEARKRKKVKCG